MHLANYVEEVLEKCEVRQDFDKAPRLPIAGTSTVLMFDGNCKLPCNFIV